MSHNTAFLQSELAHAEEFLAERRAAYAATPATQTNRDTRRAMFAAIGSAEADVEAARADLAEHIAVEHGAARCAQRAAGRARLAALVKHTKGTGAKWTELRDLLKAATAAAAELTEAGKVGHEHFRAAQAAHVGQRSPADDTHLLDSGLRLAQHAGGAGPAVAQELAELIRDFAAATPVAGSLNRMIDFSFASAAHRTDLVAAAAESVKALVRDQNALCQEPAPIK